MLLLCFHYDYVIRFRYVSKMFMVLFFFFYYTDKTYDSEDNIPISQLVLKRKALDDEQEEDEEE